MERVAGALGHARRLVVGESPRGDVDRTRLVVGERHTTPPIRAESRPAAQAPRRLGQHVLQRRRVGGSRSGSNVQPAANSPAPAGRSGALGTSGSASALAPPRSAPAKLRPPRPALPAVQQRKKKARRVRDRGWVRHGGGQPRPAPSTLHTALRMCRPSASVGQLRTGLDVRLLSAHGRRQPARPPSGRRVAAAPACVRGLDFQLMADSMCAPAATRVSSLPGGPTSCRLAGRWPPVGTGMASAGQPARLNGAVSRV